MRRIFQEFWLNSVGGNPLLTMRLRRAVLRIGGVNIHGAGVRAGQHFIGGANVTMLDGVFVNHGCLFDCEGEVLLEEDVAVGPRAQFLTSSHEVSIDAKARAGQGTLGRIVVGRGTWIGAGVSILPGVTVGAGCVIAAGAVVARDCAPNGLYRGVPAHRHADLPTRPSISDRERSHS